MQAQVRDEMSSEEQDAYSRLVDDLGTEPEQAARLVLGDEDYEAVASEDENDEPEHDVAVIEVSDGWLVSTEDELYGTGDSTGEDATPYQREGDAENRAERIAAEGPPETENDDGAEELPTFDVSFDHVVERALLPEDEVENTLDDLSPVAGSIPEYLVPVQRSKDVFYYVRDGDGNLRGKGGDKRSDGASPYWSAHGAHYSAHVDRDLPGKDNALDAALSKYEDE